MGGEHRFARQNWHETKVGPGMEEQKVEGVSLDNRESSCQKALERLENLSSLILEMDGCAHRERGPDHDPDSSPRGSPGVSAFQ